jgi:hypothetical protein
MGLRACVLWSVALLVQCTVEERETETKRSASYPNDRTILVTKRDRYAHARGMITGHDYGTTHNFDYGFELQPDDIEWSNYSSEPKALWVCGQTLYLRYLAHKVLPPTADAGSAHEAGLLARRPRDAAAGRRLPRAADPERR